MNIRAKSQIKIKAGDLNIDWTFPKGMELSVALEEMLKLYLHVEGENGLEDLVKDAKSHRSKPNE